jgi:hypothetical protein
MTKSAVLTKWNIAYCGIIRDSFWSEHLDAGAAKAEYLAARPWLAADRVSLH